MSEDTPCEPSLTPRADQDRATTRPLPAGMGADSIKRLGAEALTIEAETIRSLAASLDESFVRAVELCYGCRGRVVVTGLGKSGHVGRKIAATLASTGTPSFFVHGAEALHGDLGMYTRDDVVIALSNSGETAELVFAIPTIKDIGARVIAVTSRPKSSMARLADVHVTIPVTREADPLDLAPTASSTATLAFGDALACVLMRLRGFTPEQFARFHPGGSLGRKLLGTEAAQSQ